MSPRVWGVLVAAASLAGCFSEHVSAPPTTAVSFANDIQPVLTNNCANSGCHGTPVANPTAKPMVLVAGQAYDNMVGVSSAELPTMQRIRVGKPDSSYVIHKLMGTHRTVGGSGQQMPLGRAPLSLVTIEMIRSWVANGAPRN